MSKESERIIKSGGVIHPIQLDNGTYVGPERVWAANSEGPGLAMSRSLGDQRAKRLGVTWEPDIKEYFITPNDKFLLIASDGLWDALSNKECM